MLQRELAYWFSTQLVPKVVSEQTKPFMAKDVMPFLAEQLKPDATERWRVGMVKKQNGRLSGGHALTPIGGLPHGLQGGPGLPHLDRLRVDVLPRHHQEVRSHGV